MKRRLTILALTTLAVVALISVVLTVSSPAHAGGPPPHAQGATQISGTGYDDGECTDFPPDPANPVLGYLSLNFTGDLDGCFYTYVLSFEDSPSGTYRETGIDIYVGGGAPGDSGQFSMDYLFTAKFDEEGNEIWGRCQHPIIADSGTGDFEGVTGRLDLKDDVGPDTITFRYKGHLR